jgi:O-antigen ligase
VEYLIKNTSRWISFGGFGLALMCLFLSRSASIMFAVIAVIASAVVALLAEGRNREDRHRLYRVSWIGAFMAAFYVVQYRDFIFDFIGKAPDASGRGHIWFEVAKLISKRPVQGWGWIGYWLPGAKPLDHLVEVGGVQQYHAHNAYLDITMQLGLIGIFLFVPLLVLTFVKLWQLAVRQSSPLYLWPILVFAGILVQNLTESRMLVENGWILICIFMVKVNEPLLPIRESAASDQS